MVIMAIKVIYNYCGTFILVINQLDAQNFCFTISLFHASTYFEQHVLLKLNRQILHKVNNKKTNKNDKKSGLRLPSTAQRSEKLTICSKTKIQRSTLQHCTIP